MGNTVNMEQGGTIDIELLEDMPLCSCGVEGRASVFDYERRAFLYLCSTHYDAWTVDRVSAQLPAARWAWAESSATVREHARRDNVHSRGMRDHHYWRRYRASEEG